MMRMFVLLLLMPLLAFAREDDRTLYLSYLDYQIIEQVGEQVQEIKAEADFEVGAQIDLGYGDWRRERLQGMRHQLHHQLGKEARYRFQQFVADIQTAERQKDETVLARIATALDLPAGIETYSDLRQATLTEHCASNIKVASRFLSEIQTWKALQGGAGDVPPLRAWIAREEPVASKAQIAAHQPTNPLREAEAQSGGEWVPPDDDIANPMDTFSERRKAKRERALADAQTGMRQIAQERAAYEQDVAAKELARAQTDSEAMRDQAQRLAATEQEALAQRENSWGNRLKRIVAGTVSAATGAFTGGLGAEAGQRAAAAIFN